MISLLDWAGLVLTAAAALFQYWVAGKEPSESRSVRVARLVVVLLFLVTVTSFYGNTLEKSDNLHNILQSIRRSLDKIEDVSAIFQATVPASEPDVVAFKQKVLANSALCLEELRGFKFQSIKPACIKYLSQDQPAYMRLGTVDLLLDFFRSVSERRKLQQPNPDLALGFSASLGEGSLNLGYDSLKDTFVLQSSNLRPYAFEAPGEIVSVADLANAKVEIRVRSAERDDHGEQERVQFAVVYLDFKGAHTWKRRISRAETERLKGPSYPTYLYRITATVPSSR